LPSANQAPDRHSLSEGARRILDVASRLFAEAGFEGVSIARIAREAGVGKATIFHHFPSKEALHKAALWQINERALWLIEDRPWQQGSIEDCIAGFIHDQLSLFAENDDLLRLVRREIMEGRPESLTMISDAFSGPFARLRGYLEARRQAGDLSKNSDTALLAWLMMEIGVNAHEGSDVLSTISGLEIMRDREAFSRRMAQMLLAGCLCPPEVKDSNDRNTPDTMDREGRR